MSARTSSLSPARLLTTFSLVLGLALSMFVTTAIGPTAPPASAMITAATGERAVDWARSRKGAAYSWGAVGPNRFDCSGLTRWVYAHVGKSLPHSSSAQAANSVRISRSNARRGDLVFFYAYGGIYHVGIYAGDNMIWSASRPGTPVRKSRIWTSSVFFGRVR